MFCVYFIEQSFEPNLLLNGLLALSSERDSLGSLDRTSVSCRQKETHGQQKDGNFHGLMFLDGDYAKHSNQLATG